MDINPHDDADDDAGGAAGLAEPTRPLTQGVPTAETLDAQEQTFADRVFTQGINLAAVRTSDPPTGHAQVVAPPVDPKQPWYRRWSSWVIVALVALLLVLVVPLLGSVDSEHGALPESTETSAESTTDPTEPVPEPDPSSEPDPTPDPEATAEPQPDPDDSDGGSSILPDDWEWPWNGWQFPWNQEGWSWFWQEEGFTWPWQRDPGDTSLPEDAETSPPGDTGTDDSGRAPGDDADVESTPTP